MLAIVIVDYKSVERTLRYVREELAKISAEKRLVIVDNASDAAARQKLCAALGAREVGVVGSDDAVACDAVVVDAGGNVGFARGNNLGAEVARRLWQLDYLLFTNNDIRFVEPDVVDYLTGVLAAHPDAGIAAPDVVGTDGRRQSPAPYWPFWANHLWKDVSRLWLTEEARRKRYALDYAEQAQEGFHYRVLGGFFLARAADFQACGGFDPATFLFYEEMILSERLRAVGRGVYWTPQRKVIHEHSATINRHVHQREKEKLALKSELYYYRNYRHYSRLSLLIGKWWITLSNWKKSLFRK